MRGVLCYFPESVQLMSTLLAMPSQKAGVSLNIIVPLDTIDKSGFSHHKGFHSLPVTTSQGPVVASSASALLAAHHRTKETQYTCFPPHCWVLHKQSSDATIYLAILSIFR